MRSVRQSFRNFRKRLTRKRKLKSRTPSNTKKKVSTIKGRKISQRTKTPMVKKTTSSQRKSIGKHIKTKCLKEIVIDPSARNQDAKQVIPLIGTYLTSTRDCPFKVNR